MAILSNGKFYGFLCSAKETGQKLANGAKEYVEDFVSGFAGHGWKIWEYVKGKWRLDIDTIVVRETMLVFEMLISKIRAIIGAQAITQGHGKVKSVSLSEDGTEYLVELEDEDMSIAAHDFVRCQTFTGDQSKLYHVEVSSVDVETRTLHIPLSEFNQDEAGNVLNPPTVGDELVQFGNSQNKERQSAIYMHADETGQPAIDVMFDIDSKNWEGKVKVRVGGDIPGANGLKGFYCENGMIKSVDNRGTVIYEFSPNGAVNIGKGNIVYNPTTNKVTFGSGVTLTWDNLSEETKENIKGEPGADGNDGMSVYIIYHDSEEEPAPPIGNGTSGGWHTDATNAVIWMSQKVSDSAATGEWGNPIKIKGNTGEPGQDANLLPWIKEWNNNKTLIGKESVISPKMFSGTNSGTALNPILTGVAIGRDVVEINGEKKTGVFGIKENDTTFELNALTGEATFKGNMYSQKGEIGGFTITRTGLENAGNIPALISIKADNVDGSGRSVKREATLGNTLPDIMGIDTAAYITAESAHENIALLLRASGSTINHNMFGGLANFAISAKGGCNWNMDADDHWCMPGVLGTMRLDISNNNGTAVINMSKWGNGVRLIGVRLESYSTKPNDGNFVKVRYEPLGHTNYFIIAQTIGQDFALKGVWGLAPCLEQFDTYIDKYTRESIFTFWRSGEKFIPQGAFFVFIGQPSLK